LYKRINLKTNKYMKNTSVWQVLIAVVVPALVFGGAVYLIEEIRIGELRQQNFALSETISMVSGEPEATEAPDIVEEAREKTDGRLVLPQIYFLGKAYYSEDDINDLQANVIKPLVDYYESQDYIVVSIDIDNDSRGSIEKNSFIFSVIISNNDGNQDPLYVGFVHDKVDGEIPVWEPEEVPEGYRG